MSGDRDSRRDDVAREVDEELRLHIRMRAEDNERSGMDPEDARREAERAFGDYRRIARASLYERTAPRDSQAGRRRWRDLAVFFDTLYRDVRYTLRGFARQPGLCAAAVITLAIGLGATTAMYSLANWVLLRPIPGVDAPEDLSHVYVGNMMPEGGFRVAFISIPNFNDVAARMTTTEQLAYYQHTPVSVAFGSDGAESMLAGVVSPAYFDILGLQPAIGRNFTAAEAAPGANASVVIIGHGLWTSRYDRDPGVLGTTFRVNGISFAVIGVAPEGFEGSELFEGLDLWVPGSTYSLINRSGDPERYANRNAGFFYMLLARRTPGITWSQVSAEFDSMEAWLLEQFPETNEQFAENGFHVFGTFGVPPFGDDVKLEMLTLLLAGSVLVLLIASANVANLLLMRGLGRQSEIALRRALGCGRVRLMRQHLTEGIVLWLIGGLVGLGVARLLVSLFQGADVGYTELAEVPLDARVLMFAVATSLVVGLSFALFPALAARRVAAASSLRGGIATAGSRRLWARSTLTVVQLAASLTLFVAALLLMRTLGNLAAVDLGFDPEDIYTFSGSTYEMSYSQPETFEYFKEFGRRLRLRPEIEEVAVSTTAPLERVVMLTRLYPADEEPEESVVTARSNLLWSPQYFELFRIPLVRGRTFTRNEITPPGQDPPPVVILSEMLAQQLFDSIDVVGRAVAFTFGDRKGKRYEVIGVAGDVHHGSISTPPQPLLYEPAGSGSFIGYRASIAVRVTAPVQVADIARNIGADLDDTLPVGEVRAMDDALADARSQWALLTKLMTLLAIFAAVLAAVGLHGVVAFMVRARTREIGIRVALGASTRCVFRLVLRGVTVTTTAGLLLGLAGAVALVRVLESRLYGVEPFDVGAWMMAAAAMVAVSLVAAFLPARRATRVDPVVTLRFP